MPLLLAYNTIYVFSIVTKPNYKESLDKTCHIKQGFHCVYVYANVPFSEWAKDMLISLSPLAFNNNDMLFVDSTHV